MKKLVLLIVLIAAVALVGAKPQSMRIVSRQAVRQQPVEQQTPGGATQPDRSLWVVNPTECIWDTDDAVWLDARGLLQPGETFIWEECIIADFAGDAHLWYAHVAAEKGAEYRVTMLSPEVGFSVVSGSPRPYNNRQNHILGCVLGPDYERDSPDLVPIPDSNGGVGKWITVRWEITNTGTKRIRKMVAMFGIRWGQAGVIQDLYCPSGKWLHQTGERTPDRPYIWWSIY